MLRGVRLLLLSLVAACVIPAGPRAIGQESDLKAPRRVPILMYHVLAEPGESTPFPELWVSPDDFRAQVAWLRANGYQAITLRSLWRHWERRTTLPRRPVILTFDDGFRSHIQVALPTLRELGWPGVLNLAVSHLKPHGDLRPVAVRELLRAGWELASHSLTHRDLTTLSDQDLHHELARSRALLGNQFGVAVDFFCYPAGRYDARVVEAVRRAGYVGATTTRYGLARQGEPFTLARVRVDGSDGVADLARQLEALERDG